MKNDNWIKEFGGAITVCDKKGIIIAMNDKAIKTFAKDGGAKLIGKNVIDCHPGASKAKLKKMMKRRTVNVYSIEKNGIKKLIYQSPWYKKGKYMGFLEISLKIPFKIPHFIRK
jgi:transcriptional regulator with PAS, ATPase and Fis domain